MAEEERKVDRSHNRLYMASSHSVYALYVEAHGAV
jgi:hypothetical protein